MRDSLPHHACFVELVTTEDVLDTIKAVKNCAAVFDGVQFNHLRNVVADVAAEMTKE